MPAERQAAITIPWTARVRRMRTRQFLKGSSPLDRRDIDRLDRLDRDELAAASINPDHSDAGRAAALELLKRRGGRQEEVAINVPGFVKPASVEDLAQLFLGRGRSVRVISGWSAMLIAAAGFVAIILQLNWQDDALQQGVSAGLITQTEWADRSRKLTEAELVAADPGQLETFKSETRLENLLIPRVAETQAGRKAAAAQSVGYLLVGLWVAAFAVWFLASLFRSQPARVLVLRKFNDRKLAQSMEALIQTELRPFGHVITLSDKHFRRSMWEMLGHMIPSNFLHLFLIVLWVPWRLVRRQFNRAKNGPARVWSARDFRNLARRLRERTGLNFEMFWTSKEVIMVRTSDAWWREVIAMLITSADVVVADLSNVTSGTQWELERLQALDLYSHAVLVARSDRAGEAEAVRAGYPGAAGRTLHLYRSGGDMQDQNAFRADILQAIATSVAAAD
jgi:hypothetical protein